MGRWFKNITLSLLAAVISVTALTGPVFATPTNPTTDPDTTVTTPTNPDETTNPTTNPDEESTDTEEEQTETPTCYDQVGGIGWLICPGTGFLANVIDGAYSILDNLLRVNPLPGDPNSPIHIVWDYIRGITNLIFVCFFLVIIFSQLTGVGINNYGIKRMLPRLIVAAILINLSYVICTLAVDLSNIFGIALRNVFQNIQDTAIANGTINEIASGTSFAGIVATILGIGTIGTVAALTFAGGITGVIWLLIPVVLAGAIAIISAVVTMAARQALIFLLVMIAPLAFVCYLLPNTEKWFRTWYQMFFRMIFFYPMFSVLYGASQLAGFITITSATSWLGVVLGIAIQVLPLFLSIPLMRMAGTVLGGIDRGIRRFTDPATGLLHRRAAEGRALARARQLGSQNNIPHNRLARWLEQRRTNREFDLQQTLASNKDTYMTNAATSMVRGRDRKQLNGRGVRYYNMQARKMQNQIARTQFETDMDEGFDDGVATGVPIVRNMRNAQIARTNRAFQDAIIDDHVAKTRQRSVARTNMENRANRIHDALSDENTRANTQIHQQVTAAFRQNNAPAAGSAEELAVKRSVNDVLADAISQKRRVDSEMKSSYLELYDDSPAGKYVERQLVEAIKTHDYNSASAAMITMAKRGDHGDLIRTMVEHSGEISDNFAMQKNMADTGLSLKKENLYLWAWAKANMIRRGMSDGNDPNNPDQNVASYIDMETFLRGGYMAGDGAGAHDKLQKATMKQIFEDLNGWGPVASQDRTVFKEMFKLIQDGHIPIPVDGNGNESFPLLFPEKYIRSAAVSGLMDGEQLGTLNKLLTGGYDKNATQQSDWFYAHQGMIENQLMSYVNNMVASQLVSSKSSTIKDINGALLAIHPNDYVEMNVDGNVVQVSSQLYHAFDQQRAALNKPSAINQRNAMNKEIRQMFGISLN